MAGRVLEMAFSLLLLASIIQGGNNSEQFLYETLEAEVGQNIIIPCVMKDGADRKIVSFKWMKNGGTNLAIYNPIHGQYLYWPNVTIQEKRNENVTGTELHLPSVNKWDSGIYSCEITIFASDSFTIKTTLTVNDEIKLLRNADKEFEVPFGDNVTILCTVNSNAQYSWTKDNKLVSENKSLELWQVTEADAGVYELTVNTGSKSLHKEFIISVLTTTTSLTTGFTKQT
ncbi:junctional adhesion molecule-like [Fundulus diaphanus]